MRWYRQQFLKSTCIILITFLRRKFLHVVMPNVRPLMLDPLHTVNLFQTLPFLFKSHKETLSILNPTALVWPNYFYSVYVIRSCRPMFLWENPSKAIRLIWNHAHRCWSYNESEANIDALGERVCYFPCCGNWDFDTASIIELFCNCKHES